MDITTPIDFLLLQGGLWDLQDRNMAECLTVFPQIVNAVLNFQPSVEILLVSPGRCGTQQRRRRDIEQTEDYFSLGT